MALYRANGVVLRTYKLGEADRIIILFTRGHGKVRAVAKGVRRTRSKFGSRLEPGCVASLQLYEGRNLDVITQVETEQLHPNLRTDIDRFGRATVLLEIVDQVGQEGEPNPALYKLLAGALAELDRGGNPLVVPAFAAKVLALEGVAPMLDACVSCGSTERLVAIEIHEGGVLCHNCRRGEAMSEAARQTLIMVFAGHVRHVLQTTPPEVSDELEHLASRMLEQHLERRLRTSTLLYQQVHPAS